MKTYLAFLFAGVIAINLLLAKVAFQPSPVATATTWQYRLESVPDEAFTQKMNNIGSDGWEMVFARRASDGAADFGEAKFSYEVILKRPVVAGADGSPSPGAAP